jgi:16S rRNA (guanine(966)-N(2))-methyltransferase RsmD
MRIIGGTAGKRRILVPPRGRLRPTEGRVKEALFQILPDMMDRDFLDLFAGAGSVGLEAISRGARRVVFVEKDRRLAATIRKNLQLLGFAAAGAVWDRDWASALKMLEVRGDRFDIVFADPPYERAFADLVLRRMATLGVLGEGGCFILQHSRREGLSDPGEGRLRRVDRRMYGDTVLSLFSAS